MLDGGGNGGLKKRGNFHSMFISNIYIEYLVCAKCWGYRSKPGKGPASWS